MLIFFLVWVCKKFIVMNGDQLSLFPKLWSHTEGQHLVTSHFVAQSESTVKPFLSISYPQCTTSSHHWNFCIISTHNGNKTHGWWRNGVTGNAVRIKLGYKEKRACWDRHSQTPREAGPNLCPCGQVTKRPHKRSSLGDAMLSFLRL